VFKTDDANPTDLPDADVYVLINKRNHFQALDIGYCKKTESTNYIDIQPMYRVGLACGCGTE